MIWGTGGNLSGGKTAFLNYLAKEYLDLGYRIVSNIKLSIPHTYISNSDFVDIIQIALTQEENTQKIIEDNFSNSFLLLDEINNLLSSRRSNSNLNAQIVQFVMMAGKIDCNIGYSFQVFSSQVDKQLREVTNILALCKRVKASDHSSMFFEPRIVSYPILIKIKLWIDTGDKILTKNFILDPSDIFTQYNTRKILMLNRDKYLRR